MRLIRDRVQGRRVAGLPIGERDEKCKCSRHSRGLSDVILDLVLRVLTPERLPLWVEGAVQVVDARGRCPAAGECHQQGLAARLGRLQSFVQNMSAVSGVWIWSSY